MDLAKGRSLITLIEPFQWHDGVESSITGSWENEDWEGDSRKHFQNVFLWENEALAVRRRSRKSCFAFFDRVCMLIELEREGLGAEQGPEKVNGDGDGRWGWLEGGARSTAVTTGKAGHSEETGQAGQAGWMAELIAQGSVRERPQLECEEGRKQAEKLWSAS